MEVTKIHRIFDDKSEYRAISALAINESGYVVEIIYYEKPVNKTVGVELYTGENYLFGSKNRSWSRSYKMDKVPKKYLEMVKELKWHHNLADWTIDENVNVN
jgi:hypothetical protein